MISCKTSLAMILTAALCACGGGGNSSDSPGAAAAHPLQKYAGRWANCYAGREMVTITLTPTGANLADQTYTSDFYSGPNCTGTVVAREVSSASWTVTHNATEIKSVAGISTNPANYEVDRVTVSIGPYSKSISGPNVVTTTRGGVTKDCVTFADSPSICTERRGLQPAASESDALYVAGDLLFALQPAGSGYTVCARYQR